MKKRDVLSIRMKSFYKTRDRDLERILMGKEPADGAHDDLRRTVEQLRAAFPADPIPADVEAAHVAAMMEHARATTCAAASVAGERAGAQEVAGPQPSRRNTRGYRRLYLVASSHSLRIAVIAILGLGLLGGVATAGALPDGLQSAVSRAAGVVGIEIPDGRDRASVPAVPDETGQPLAPTMVGPSPAAEHGGGGAGTTSAVQSTAPDTVPSSVPATASSTLPTEAPTVTVPAAMPTTTEPTVPATVPSTNPALTSTTLPGSVPPDPPLDQ